MTPFTSKKTKFTALLASILISLMWLGVITAGFDDMAQAATVSSAKNAKLQA